MSAADRGPVPASEATTDTRMVIRDIEVENFKSYAGKHRIGPFHKTFTAVIGPNGSGKSNVIDAMLFVFGKNAKKIRLERLSELIHSSAAHPSLTYASVTVHFVRVVETPENQGDPEYRQEVAGSLLSIKREVYKSGSSQYFIDRVKTTQREVVESLIAEGVDLEHNRFLILQGEVEQIALMKPKAEREGEEGLLEYLDDLIGTNSFSARISEASKVAEAAQLSRLEALDRERKLRAEREALDDAKDSAVAFVTKDNHLQKTLIAMCQLRMQTLEEKLAEPRRLLTEIDERITCMKQGVEARSQEKVKLDEDLLKRKKDLAEATKERDAVRTKKEAADAEVERIRSGADEQTKARKKAQDQLRRVKEEAQKAELQQQDADREVVIHQQNFEESKQRVEKLQKEYESTTEELAPVFMPLRQELERRKAAFAPYERAVVEATEQLDTARSRLGSLDNRGLMLQEQLTKIETATERNERRAADVEKLLQDASKDRYKEELQRLQEMLAGAAERKHSVNGAIQEIKNTYREGEADDRAMEFLLAQRSLKGYYGTLRQLGRIADEYDIAAGVASNAWGFHVVEDRETAAAALELLRKNNIGRATMMVLKEIEREIGARMNAPFTSPSPKATRLFEHIVPTNERFRVAFYQAVRDTLLVRDLGEAREVAFGGPQRFRVVTVRGELAEPGGSITGGGSTPRGAKLKAARSPQDKEAAKVALQRLQSELVEAVEEERVAQEQLHKLRQSHSHLTPEQISKLRIELGTLRATLECDAKKRTALLQEMQENTTGSQSQRDAILEEVDEAEKNLQAAQKARLKHHSDLERIEQEVDNVGGAGYKALCVELKTQQERMEAEENAIRQCRRLSQRLRATQQRKQSDIAELEEELKRISEEAVQGASGALAAAIAASEEWSKRYNGAEAKFAKAQSDVELVKAALPVAHKALIEAQKLLDDEERFRQVEMAKMADALQELAKFEQKIDGCEEKMRENAELYGIETLQLNLSAEEEQQEQGNGGAGGGGGAAEEHEEEEEDGPGHSNRNNRRNNDELVEHVEERLPSSKQQSNTMELRNMSFRLSPEELARCDYEHSVRLAKSLSEETKRLHGEIDFRAVALWRERDAEHRKGKIYYLSCKEASDAAERELQELKEERRGRFMQCFVRVQERLRKVYQLLTHGGDADLELVDVNDPFEGIHFVVRPPKKSWKQISNLSGGEKTLSSLALIFALHDIKPTPIYVMDEIDAALDFRNVSIVANYLLRQANGAQFIIISLRNNMFEMAHQLVGVCKVKDVTRTLVLMPRGFQRTVEAELLRQQRKRTASDMDGVPNSGRSSSGNDAEAEEANVEVEGVSDERENATGAATAGRLMDGKPCR
ncbi:putative structural maintenance of chromosome protein 4 [Trypanosoma rangeli]|uniref:Structural maintenance of chromosomes protein n=1 Tax=Trypanosoma rangeli TaxID=5698 RepID=A0A3R7MMZ3_TRYRA|nr:putative structural maintenance of chromosome protein 4 [Trypanosoma rangeli]RNF08495.1 putative structural maintenance of chromosome protein 4 [Trypanosoma rangeli]|eukprot:RNF08495.1 putative structural maintenance of chromosome protein 4 [Trypanosoma rangeli]